MRRTLMLKWKDGISPEERLQAKEGLAYLGYACRVLAIDFGEDLRIGLPSNFDLVVMHDHASSVTLAAFDEDPAHGRFRKFLGSVTRSDATVRVLWEHDGPPSQKGMVRHTAIFRWRNGVSTAQKDEAWELLNRQRKVMPWLRWFACHADVSGNPSHHDWVLEAHFDDVEGYLAYSSHPLHKKASELNQLLTQDAITARVQHVIRMG